MTSRSGSRPRSWDRNEVIDEELRATVEEFRERPGTVAGVEAVLLLDQNPGELPSHPGEVVAHACVLLLEPKQLVTSGEPFVTRSCLVIDHRHTPSTTSPAFPP